MTKEYWITNSRFKLIAIILLILWLGVMLLLYLKADEVTNDPCSICAKRLGEQVRCTTLDFEPIVNIYYPNYTIENVRTNILQD